MPAARIWPVTPRARAGGASADTRGNQRYLVAALALVASGCAAPVAEQPVAVPELRPGIPAGYLSAEQRPDSLKLVPPPPAAGSAAYAADRDAARRSRIKAGTPRWQVAVQDADLRFPHAAGTFSCSIGVAINEQDTPRLYMLLRRTMVDAGLATYGAKERYQRARPFMVNKLPTCTPDEAAALAKDGSYPSGHNAVGWAWALILAEIAPANANAILARGLAYGQSRLTCNVHWQSDATQGRIMGAAAVAVLHSNAVFRADLDAARAELEAARAKGLQPTRDCAMENAALNP